MPGVDQTPECLSYKPNLNFAISTVDRPNSYIHQTLASLMLGGFPKNCTINIMVCGPDATFLQNYQHHKNIRIHPILSEDWDKIKDWPIQQKSAYNYLRCMRVGDFANSIVMEDDIVFKDDWYLKLMRVLKDIEEDGYKKEPFLLSLFTVNRARSERRYFQYQKIAWACSQCIFFPETVKDVLAEHIEVCTKDVIDYPEKYSNPARPEYSDAYDMLMKEYISDHEEFKIFCPVESLVQHVGKVSSGGNGDSQTEFIFSDCF